MFCCIVRGRFWKSIIRSNQFIVRVLWSKFNMKVFETWTIPETAPDWNLRGITLNVETNVKMCICKSFFWNPTSIVWPCSLRPLLSELTLSLELWLAKAIQMTWRYQFLARTAHFKPIYLEKVVACVHGVRASNELQTSCEDAIYNYNNSATKPTQCQCGAGPRLVLKLDYVLHDYQQIIF